jgi:hypothetical protein
MSPVDKETTQKTFIVVNLSADFSAAGSITREIMDEKECEKRATREVALHRRARG